MKILSWSTTVLLALGYTMSGAFYLSGAQAIVDGVHGHLGYPTHLLPLLGALKVLGAVALLVPGFPKIREWAYAGIGFNLLGAAWAHAAVDGPLSLGPIAVFTALWATSYATQDHRKLRAATPVATPATA